MLLRYCPNDFQVVPVAPGVTGMTFVFTLLLLSCSCRAFWLINIYYYCHYVSVFLSIITMILLLSALAIFRLFCSGVFFICFKLYWCRCNNNNNNYYYYYLLLVVYIRQWWMIDFSMFMEEGREWSGERKVFCSFPHNLTSGSGFATGSSVQSFILSP
jgi:hypothetical protein